MLGAAGARSVALYTKVFVQCHGGVLGAGDAGGSGIILSWGVSGYLYMNMCVYTILGYFFGVS